MIVLQRAAVEVIEPIAYEQLLWLFLVLTVLLFVARVLGELARRVDLPAVVGELTAGILLGPSVVDVTSIVFETVFPAETALEPQFHLLEVVSWLGLLFLIVLTGLETDLDLVVARGVDAALVSAASIVVPFALGFAFAWYLPERFVAAPGQRFVFSLFVGTALSISAIPVIATILLDMDAIRRDFGQILLAVGMINDTVGWILLALVAGLARTGRVDLTETGLTALALVVFLAVSLTVGRRIAPWIVRFVDDIVGGQAAKLTTLVVLALAVGSLTHAFHLEAVLGAFVVGILVGESRRFDYETERSFETITLGVFAPIFFATAGLRVDLGTLVDPVVLAAAAAALAIAVAGKFVGSYVGAALAGLPPWEGITLGAGLNARGAMEIIVATIGLGLGVLTVEMYSIVVVIAIVTSLMAPPLLRLSLPNVPMSDRERTRLDRERRDAESFLGNATTILLATRCGVDSRYAAQLLGSLAREYDVDATHLYVGRSNDDSAAARSESPIRDDGGRCLDALQSLFDPSGERTARRLIRPQRERPDETILSVARREYDMLVVGSEEWGGRSEGRPFSDTIDAVVRDAPCPVTVVSAADAHGPGLDPASVSRIVLPTVGAEYNRRAAEVAFSVAAARNAVVEVLHVVDRSRAEGRRADAERARRVGRAIVDAEATLGRRLGARVRTNVVVTDREPEDVIVRRASDRGADLVVLGASVRPASGQAFLGHRAEAVVRCADCGVAVVCSV